MPKNIKQTSSDVASLASHILKNPNAQRSQKRLLVRLYHKLQPPGRLALKWKAERLKRCRALNTVKKRKLSLLLFYLNQAKIGRKKYMSRKDLLTDIADTLKSMVQ
nr:hypothetical protein [Vibrio cholerae]